MSGFILAITLPLRDEKPCVAKVSSSFHHDNANNNPQLQIISEQRFPAIYHGLRLHLQLCIVAPYLLLRVIAFYAVSCLTLSYVHITLVASHNHNSVQSFNSLCLRTVSSPSQTLVWLHRLQNKCKAECILFDAIPDRIRCGAFLEASMDVQRDSYFWKVPPDES